MPGNHHMLQAMDDVSVERVENHRPPLVTIECKRKATADAIRADWPDAVVDDQDDARRVRVTVSGDVLEEWLAEMVAEAAEDYAAEREQFGQEPLTLSERRQIDFTRTNVPHARSCKAIARGRGVDDWLAFYDHTLTVDEHRDIYRRETGGLTGREMANPFRPTVTGGASA